MTPNDAPRPRITIPRVEIPSAARRQWREAIRERLQRDPGQREAWLALGSMERALGNLEAAAQAYAACGPDHPLAAYMHDLLVGAPRPESTLGSELRTPPFIYLEDFLSETTVAEIHSAFERQREAFHPHEVTSGGGVTGRLDDYRRSFGTRGDDETRELILTPVRAALAEQRIPERLGVSFDAGDIEIELSSHLDHGMFVPHRDAVPAVPTRRLTFVYYFHRLPKRYQGGDILFYDDHGPRQLWIRSCFTRLTPKHNSILFFPSDRVHEVTPVSCSSDDVFDGRTTIRGCFHDGWMSPAQPA
ncbi:2OG-Fe(II) oxygenase [Endothiovibrio diazotrophicus]